MVKIPLNHRILPMKYYWLPIRRHYCANSAKAKPTETVVLGESYPIDEWTNVKPSILDKVGMNLHSQKYHPLGLIRLQIQDYFYKTFTKRGNPIFSVYDNLSPVVTLEQNFDNLLVPQDHVSRKLSDSFYLNSTHMLRAHTTAHQKDLIKTGLNSFLFVGDVYRRDEIDSSHYPVFHQLDGVRLFSKHEIFPEKDYLSLFEDKYQTDQKQSGHTLEAALTVSMDLKKTLEGLATALFGKDNLPPSFSFMTRSAICNIYLDRYKDNVTLKDTETRWVEAYFPFTHPSWELEIKYQDKWLEVLGCGVIQQEILQTSGAGEKIGWAFGMGLERLAMKLYNIPDIRLFWSKDTGFLNQFKVDDPSTPISYKPISIFPQCSMDISFWITDSYEPNDFFDLVRSIGGDLVEHVENFDVFKNPKTQKTSHAYRITYRHMERTLTKEEVNVIHKKIEAETVEQFGVQIR